MKKLFIIANWKSHKTTDEAINWLKQFQENTAVVTENKEIIVCPSFTLLAGMHAFIKENNLPIKLGGQDISPFDEGAYTGAVNAKQLKEFADYVLIGHSERRSNFLETDEMVAKKVERALSASLQPIFFVQEKTTPIPSGVQLVVYEPPSAISTVSNGVPDSPEDVAAASEEIKNTSNIPHIVYGGSVDGENVSKFTSLPIIEGVVPGKASLEASSFMQILANS